MPHKAGLVRQAGNMMMMAIFTIVILGFVGLGITRIFGTSADALVYEVYGLRALNAARSGLDDIVLQVFTNQASDPAFCTAASDPDNRIDFTVSGLENCHAQFGCAVNQIGDTNYYRFESQGTCEIDNIVVSRTIAIDAKDIVDD